MYTAFHKPLTKEIVQNKKKNKMCFYHIVLSEEHNKWYLKIARVNDFSDIELRILILINLKGRTICVTHK